MPSPSRRLQAAQSKSGRPPSAATAPLLMIFVVPTILVVALVGWIATGLSWGTVVLALVFIVVMTFAVLLTINRLLADDAGG
ncbi:hypothetical protein [Conexibacter arvalis]|uniref:Fatty acid desaturase n=1 Tax=Conexibacter arvalis TaxID=912552 RepID=A0A840IKA1_9ACTN|nr:hypothetical protein [Conexibacter arvalis]MBB4664755.1 fatty acid desaturase [Conexibacter arvalis]